MHRACRKPTSPQDSERGVTLEALEARERRDIGGHDAVHPIPGAAELLVFQGPRLAPLERLLGARVRRTEERVEVVLRADLTPTLAKVHVEILVDFLAWNSVGALLLRGGLVLPRRLGIRHGIASIVVDLDLLEELADLLEARSAGAAASHGKAGLHAEVES